MTPIRDIIIAWVAMGMSRKEIAHALHLALPSIEWHLAIIKRKLGFNDPARLTHYAISTKLINLNQTV